MLSLQLMDLFRGIDSSVAWEILTPWKSGSYWAPLSDVCFILDVTTVTSDAKHRINAFKNKIII